MARIPARTFDRRLMFAMAIYVAVFLAVWPQARGAADAWIKTICALVPVLPLGYVIWLIAQRVLHSDELEQRTHLIGIGVAAAVVALVSIVAGFLAAAGLLSLDTTAVVLVWIFPLLLLIYGAARSVAARRYGSAGCDDERMPRQLRLFYSAAITAFAALVVFLRNGTAEVSALLLAFAALQMLLALLFALKRRGAAPR
jgi:hypothetical protein